MASRHFPRRRLDRAASAAKARAFRRLIPFKAAGVFLGITCGCIRASARSDLYGRPGSPRPAPAALVPPQIFRGYQWVEPRSEPRRGPVLACVDSPLPLSGCLPRMRAAPAVIKAGRLIRKSMPSDVGRHRFSEEIVLEQLELQREYPRNGQCCRRRRPVGRRREGQDRRLVVGAGRHRRALPGRPQCRPYARHQRRNLQAGAAALRRIAAFQTRGDRQRRGVRSAGIPR